MLSVCVVKFQLVLKILFHHYTDEENGNCIFSSASGASRLYLFR